MKAIKSFYDKNMRDEMADHVNTRILGFLFDCLYPIFFPPLFQKLKKVKDLAFFFHFY